jgi:hypothetical protein
MGNTCRSFSDVVSGWKKQSWGGAQSGGVSFLNYYVAVFININLSMVG